MGKITVEIKKSTFGKPLHNFDHPLYQGYGMIKEGLGCIFMKQKCYFYCELSKI